ncbi:MAG: HutD family protein [Asticcacaulis sp.]
MKLTLLPVADRKTVAWKNGGGQTQEMAVFPAGAAMHNFQWRISMATVDKAGAFSVFRGIDRHLTLLEGRMRLEVNGVWHELGAGESLRFDGELPAFGAPVSASVTDLNIMTRRGRFSAEIIGGETGDVLPVEAGEGFLFALTAAEVSGHVLSAFDLLHFEATGPERLRVGHGSVLLIRLIKAAWPQGKL